VPYTMKNVASRAGVSPATVSRVLNNKIQYISEETRKRVLDAVKELNYYKNVHARRLATGQSGLFGLVISEIANPYFPEVIRGFQAIAWDRGLDVLLLNTEYDPARIQSVIRKLVESDVSGVAIMTSSIDDSATSPLTEAGIGVVFCNLCYPQRLVSNITINYRCGVLQAIAHVAELGHRRAAVISGPGTNGTAMNIRQALVAGLKQKNMAPYPLISCDYRVDAGASAVHAILSVPDVPTVIFCGSDLIAMGVMSALEGAGVRVPEDVSVIGIDDIPFAFLARPPLTTIRVPREQLGVMAFNALEKMLKLKRKLGAAYRLETELVVRASTGAARKHKLNIRIHQAPQPAHAENG
jgi:DNA-binding LacI/PurR family transcriptional regulator